MVCDSRPPLPIGGCVLGEWRNPIHTHVAPGDYSRKGYALRYSARYILCRRFLCEPWLSRPSWRAVLRAAGVGQDIPRAVVVKRQCRFAARIMLLLPRWWATLWPLRRSFARRAAWAPRVGCGRFQPEPARVYEAGNRPARDARTRPPDATRSGGVGYATRRAMPPNGRRRRLTATSRHRLPTCSASADHPPAREDQGRTGAPSARRDCGICCHLVAHGSGHLGIRRRRHTHLLGQRPGTIDGECQPALRGN